MLFCIVSAYCLHMSAQSVHQVCIFIRDMFSPGKHVFDMQTKGRIRAHFAHFVQALRILHAYLFFLKCASGALCTLGPSVQVCKKSGMHTLHTLSLMCKVCIMFRPLSGKPSKTPSNPTPMHTQAYRLLPGRDDIYIYIYILMSVRCPSVVRPCVRPCVRPDRARPVYV